MFGWLAPILACTPGEPMAKPNDASVFAHIEALVAEEHKLFEEQGELDAPKKKRLADIQAELDQYWDVLRQRRALREYGRPRFVPQVMPEYSPRAGVYGAALAWSF